MPTRFTHSSRGKPGHVVAHIVLIGMHLLEPSEKEHDVSGTRQESRTVWQIPMPGISVRRRGHEACLTNCARVSWADTAGGGLFAWVLEENASSGTHAADCYLL